MFGCAASRPTRSSWPRASVSSTSRRTRTPRWAARSIALISSLPLSSSLKMKYWTSSVRCRAVGHLQAHGERVAAAREKTEAGKAGMRFCARLHLAADRCLFRVSERAGLDLRIVRAGRHCRARGEQCDRQHGEPGCDRLRPAWIRCNRHNLVLGTKLSENRRFHAWVPPGKRRLRDRCDARVFVGAVLPEPRRSFLGVANGLAERRGTARNGCSLAGAEALRRAAIQRPDESASPTTDRAMRRLAMDRRASNHASTEFRRFMWIAISVRCCGNSQG